MGPQGPQGNPGAQGAQGPAGPAGPGLTPEDVQAMIDAAVAPLKLALALAVRIGDPIALQASGDPDTSRDGKYLSAVDGGPATDGVEFVLTGESLVTAAETWLVARGQRRP